MKKTLLSLCLLTCAHLAPGQSVTQPNQTTGAVSHANAIRRASQFADSLRVKQGIPGLSVCVGTTTNTLWASGFGLADVENSVPVTITSRFRIGSVSKSLTSLAVGKLIEAGKINPDAPVDTDKLGVSAKKYPITVRQLATHTAGIRHYGFADGLNCLRYYGSVREGLVIFSRDSLLAKPGTAYIYSTYGYSVLSAVIEEAAQMPFLTYMQTAVFDPLGMAHTGPDYSADVVPQRVRFYETRRGRLVNAAQVDNSYKWAGGGFLSTPTDLMQAARQLLGGTYLTKTTVGLLTTPQRLASGTPTDYGFGWRMGTDSKGRRLIHHGGAIDGGRTFLLLYPDHDLIIAITANMLEGTAINVPEAEAIAGFFLAGR